MPNRFYQLSYPENAKRPVYIEDAGNLLVISGILLQGMGMNIVLLSPGASLFDTAVGGTIIKPTLEEWCEFLRQSDDPLIFEQDSTGTIKTVHRKVQYAISGAVQQQIWFRDGWQCLYCGKKVPDIQVTIDHFVPLELGGDNEQHNYISACRQCQKSKGSRNPKEYCESKKLDYDGLVMYLSGKSSKLFINHLT
jgi:hypothetical protein